MVAMAATLSDDPARPLPTEVRWSVAVPARPAAPPVIGGGRVFLALESEMIAAHRLSDGVEAWHVALRADQPIAVDGDRVFVASGEAIHALASDDGAVIWRAPTGTLTAPLVAQEGWIIAAAGDALTAFRSSDGAKVWRRTTGTQHGRPSIEGENLYVPLDDGRLLSLDLRTGAERWARRLTTPQRPAAGSPPPAISEVLAYADRVFVGAANGVFYSLNASDGSLAWRFRIGAILRGGPIGDGTRVYITAMDNVVRAFDRRTGKLLWHPSVPFRPTTGPVLLGARVMVPGTASEVRAFDPAGRPAGQIKLQESLAIAPAFAEATGGNVMAAVTGSLDDQWKLLVLEQARGLEIVPLKELPGVSVPVELPAPAG
jgi:outer membrane protein assembly factor BamB